MSHYQPPTSSLDLSSFPIPPDFFPNLAAYWRPPVQHTLSSWAEANFTLSTEYAASTLGFRLYGWQKEIFDAYTDPEVEEIVLMFARQMVKTLFLQCAIAYTVVNDPGPILLMEPNDDDAKTFSKERLGPMIRDNDLLRSKISESRDAGQSTLVGKVFPGGSLSLVGTIAPANLVRRSVKVLIGDEVDLYPASAGDKGDPILIAEECLTTFGSRKKKIYCSTPTKESTSRIGKKYAETDRRKPWVPCPRCKEPQILRFSLNAGIGGVWYDSSLPREKQPASAVYLCTNIHCKASRPEYGWRDHERKEACNNHTEWRAERPFNKRAGFWMSHIYSPWKSLADIVDKFLIVKDRPEELKTFVNGVLAEQWKDAGDVPDHEVLYARRESYPYGTDAIVPQRGLFLTAFVDVQDSPPRLEVEVKAWGRNRESWSIYYDVIQCFADDGEPYPVTSQKLWDELNTRVLQRNWLHESGKYLPILAMGIDTGKKSKPVYEFALRHPRFSYNPGVGIKLAAIRTVIPTKGNDDALRILSKVSKEDAARHRQGIRILSVGTHCAKQQIFDALRSVKPSPDNRTLSGRPVPSCYHHPEYGIEYFLSLTAESRVESANGKVEYTKIRPRNEALDCAVGNSAMAAVVGIDRMTEAQWRAMEEALAASPDSSTLLPKSNVVESEAVSDTPARPSAHAGAVKTPPPTPPAPASLPRSQSQSPPPASPRSRVRARFM